jgi:multiple sugar transport system ATP-binding protein
MVNVTRPQEVLERLGRESGNGGLIAGIRPEDFEDASKVDREGRERGTTFRAKLDLVEAMGAEYYAHFSVNAQVSSAGLDEVAKDTAGTEETSGGHGTVLVARLSPESRARSGEETELWIDASKLHFFDADSGQALTHTR